MFMKGKQSMNCFYHNDITAVSSCKVCNKGLCNDCANDGYCLNCMYSIAIQNTKKNFWEHFSYILWAIFAYITAYFFFKIILDTKSSSLFMGGLFGLMFHAGISYIISVLKEASFIFIIFSLIFFIVVLCIIFFVGFFIFLPMIIYNFVKSITTGLRLYKFKKNFDLCK